jgi:hypothetical protein
VGGQGHNPNNSTSRRRYRPYRCGRCHSLGHKARTCTASNVALLLRRRTEAVAADELARLTSEHGYLRRRVAFRDLLREAECRNF